VRFSTSRIAGDMGFCTSRNFVAMCRRIKSSHFSRKRKMPLPRLLLSILHRRGTTLATELRRFMELIDANETISKPGYLKQRFKLAPEAIMALCDFHNMSLYREEEMRTFKGYLVLAVDGSCINVPTNPETLREYGTSSSPKVKQQATIGLSCMYDVINKTILCCSINRRSFDEHSQAEAHRKKVPEVIGDKKTILVLDRGYPSLRLFCSWLYEDQKFIVRLSGMNYKRERKTMKSEDEWLAIEVNKSRLYHYQGTETFALLQQAGSVRLRIVNIQLDGGTKVSLATNLEESIFSSADIARLYSLRWGVETSFDMLKNQLEVENFTGTRPILIEQDIFACVYLCNLVQDMIADAQVEFDASDRTPGKHKMAINRAYAVGVMKDELIKALLEPDIDKRSIIFMRMVDEIKKQVLPVRPGRHYPRRNGYCASENYPNTHKRCY